VRPLSLFENFSSSSDFTPDFVPHEEFHKFSWYTPSNGSWYFRSPNKKKPEVPKSRHVLLSTLDPLLVSPVSFLYKNGIPTTPSCTGHFKGKRNFSKVFKDLQETEERVKTVGDAMFDPEKNSKVVFKNSSFELPWDAHQFCERCEENSRMGVIGIQDPDNIFFGLLTGIERSQSIKDGDLTIFLTSPTTELELKKCWKDFDAVIKGSSLTKAKQL